MSEFDPTIAQTYVTLMSPAFVEGLAAPAAMDLDEATPPWVKGYALQSAIKRILETVDWDGSGLPNKIWDPDETAYGPKELKPEEYANRLMAFAFDDASQLLRLAENCVGEHLPPPQGFSIGDALLRSSKSLLRTALLPDQDKEQLFMAVKYPGVLRLDGVDGFELEKPLILLQASDGDWQFGWQGGIERFIQGKIDRSRGCPAHRTIVTDQSGNKQTLIYHFWEKLVEQSYK